LTLFKRHIYFFFFLLLTFVAHVNVSSCQKANNLQYSIILKEFLINDVESILAKILHLNGHNVTLHFFITNEINLLYKFTQRLSNQYFIFDIDLSK
jgi:hypothetical protein